VGLRKSTLRAKNNNKPLQLNRAATTTARESTENLNELRVNNAPTALSAKLTPREEFVENTNIQ
jgi:hypothetical protein